MTTLSAQASCSFITLERVRSETTSTKAFRKHYRSKLVPTRKIGRWPPRQVRPE